MGYAFYSRFFSLKTHRLNNYSGVRSRVWIKKKKSPTGFSVYSLTWCTYDGFTGIKYKINYRLLIGLFMNIFFLTTSSVGRILKWKYFGWSSTSVEYCKRLMYIKCRRARNKQRAPLWNVVLYNIYMDLDLGMIWIRLVSFFNKLSYQSFYSIHFGTNFARFIVYFSLSPFANSQFNSEHRSVCLLDTHICSQHA